MSCIYHCQLQNTIGSWLDFLFYVLKQILKEYEVFYFYACYVLLVLISFLYLRVFEKEIKLVLLFWFLERRKNDSAALKYGERGCGKDNFFPSHTKTIGCFFETCLAFVEKSQPFLFGKSKWILIKTIRKELFNLEIIFKQLI